MATRQLFKDEIAVLKEQGCRALDWSLIWVDEEFSVGPGIQDVYFSGEIELGKFNSLISGPDGIDHMTGIFASRLHNVRLGDNCLVRHSDLADVDVGHGALVNRVGMICCVGESTFANGEPANILSEHGGRCIPLWRRLSAQTAHLMCHLRGLPPAAALLDLVNRDIEALRSSRSTVGDYCRVERCGRLENVCLEEGAIVDGASELRDCYVASSRQAPARIGEGVGAEHCIFHKRSDTSGGVRLTNCLVGEGVKLERTFTAEHSLLFANCNFAQGEAVSVLAGPFSVSHHKATLVLTCQTSFSTFGSASNASNHHFKFGPLHGGILNRGVRTGSGSYLFWPADIGSFSTVTGRNNNNLDTRDFPFSLIIGYNDNTILVPAVNVFATGPFRDSHKWAARDAREGVETPLDLYHSAVLSPYTLQAVDKGMAILEAGMGKPNDIPVPGAAIPAHRIEPGLKLYTSAIVFHIGLRLIEYAQRQNAGAPVTLDHLAAALSLPEGEDGGESGEWRDWGGLLLSGGRAARFRADLEDGRFKDADALQAAFKKIYDDFPDCEWRWLAWRWRKINGAPDAEKVRDFVILWRKTVLYRRARLMRDAVKEFSVEKRISFGIEQDADSDFRQARGELESHPLVKAIEEEKDRLVALADAIL